MNIQDYIKPELLILVPSCWGLGLMLKSTPINNQWIPLVLGIFSVCMACLWVFSTVVEPVTMGVFVAVTQGIICWAAAWLSFDKAIKPNS